MILLVSVSLFAQTLSLEQARVLALANSRSLAKYDLSIKSSILDEKNQFYSMLPSLSAGYSASMNYLDKDWGFVNPLDTFTTGMNFKVTQKIFEGGKSLVQKALNSIATESVRKEAQAEYFNVLDSVDSAYYAALEAAASLEAAESSLQTAALSLSIAEIRQASGMINQGDYLKALADKEQKENSRNQARRSLSLSMTKLKALTGIAQTAELAEVDFSAYEGTIQFLAAISDDETQMLYDRFWKLLVRTNPSLARAALTSQRAEKNLSLAKRDFAPTVSATIFSTSFGYSAAGEFGSTSGGGISIEGSIPIDFWLRKNRIDKSKIARDSAGLDYLSAEISLETELETALLNTIGQAGSVLSSRRALEYAEKHFEYIMERYRLSQSSVSDAGDASSLLITNRNNFIKARYGFLQSLSKLRSLGAFDDESILIELLNMAD
ncbi:MAG: TolC family protein [Treponema sp.]|jgi:outer membrane protein TolC|nr:TolC family protein [Treponema sp.]